MIYESDYYVGADLNGDSLSHHGVPNQKWGVKNGPPYPIKRGHDVHYNVGKMTDKTKSSLSKAGKIVKKDVRAAGQAVGKATKAVGAKAKSSFTKWKEDKKADLATRDTDSGLLKNWQKKQLRISDMSNDELKKRIERIELEEKYKHALRGDFTPPKEWKKGSSGDKGKKAADSILKKVGDAAIEGLTKGLTNKTADSMTSKSKARNARREERRNAMAKVATEAAKERAEYRAEQRNEAWRQRQEQRQEQRRANRANSNSTSSRPLTDSTYGANYRNYGNYYSPNTTSTGLTAGSRNDRYYYASPGSWTIT